LGPIGKPTAILAPAPLSEAHRVDTFRCVRPELELWLKQRARKNQLEGASRTFVVCAGEEVVGYYALAAGAVLHEKAPGSIRRNMPEPIPVAVLGRLAVHIDWGARGIGAGLLKDAVLRTVRLFRGTGHSRAAQPRHRRKRQAVLPASWFCRVAHRTADGDVEHCEARKAAELKSKRRGSRGARCALWTRDAGLRTRKSKDEGGRMKDEEGRVSE
jgi:hypothetical protein